MRWPIPKQLDAYVVGITRIHPPRKDLGLVIGRQGAAVLPALFDRYGGSTTDYEKANLPWILVGMPCTQPDSSRVSEALDSFRVLLPAIENHDHRSAAIQNMQYAANRCVRPERGALEGS